MTGMLGRLGVFASSMAAMLAIDERAFRAPIFLGDTIHLEMRIESKRLTSRGVVTRRTRLLNQDGVVAQEGVITVMVLSRGAA